MFASACSAIVYQQLSFFKITHKQPSRALTENKRHSHSRPRPTFRIPNNGLNIIILILHVRDLIIFVPLLRSHTPKLTALTHRSYLTSHLLLFLLTAPSCPHP